MKNKYTTFIIILLVLVVIWIGANKMKYDQWPWDMLRQSQEKYDQEKAQQNNLQDVKSIADEGGTKEQALKQKILSDLADRIGDLSPVEPVVGGRWYVLRFWMTDNDYVYVEYEDGHLFNRILVQVKNPEEDPEYDVVAYFEPGENDWALKEGEDVAFGRDLDLYEYNDQEGEWIKQN